jgi:hypothetical protein
MSYSPTRAVRPSTSLRTRSPPPCWSRPQGAAEGVPQALKSSLIAPYIDGLRFVHALRRRGGWAEVDRAWKELPATTEQLLHLEKYDRREPPLPVPAPPLDALGGGFRVELTDLVGEQGLRIMLESWGTPKEARRAAAGWGGDRVTLLSRVNNNRDEWFVTWWVRFDSADAWCTDAAEAFAVVRKGFPSDSSAQDTVCQERSEMGPLAAAVARCDLLLAAGPFTRSGESWRSSGGCSAVRPWIRATVREGTK